MAEAVESPAQELKDAAAARKEAQAGSERRTCQACIQELATQKFFLRGDHLRIIPNDCPLDWAFVFFAASLQDRFDGSQAEPDSDMEAEARSFSNF